MKSFAMTGELSPLSIIDIEGASTRPGTWVGVCRAVRKSINELMPREERQIEK